MRLMIHWWKGALKYNCIGHDMIYILITKLHELNSVFGNEFKKFKLYYENT